MPDAIARGAAEVVVAEGRAREAQDGKVFGHQPCLEQVEQRWDQLAVGQVAGGAKDDDGAGRGRPLLGRLSDFPVARADRYVQCHSGYPLTGAERTPVSWPSTRIAWPPNSFRSAASTRQENELRSRE